jgi:RNA polymerase sigma-70 factor (ECF subfamily)
MHDLTFVWTHTFWEEHLKHYTKVWALANERLRDHHLAQDVAQETFLRLWKKLKHGEAILNLRAWLLRVAHNLAEDYAKNLSRRRITSLPQDMAEINSLLPSPDESVYSREMEAAIRAELAALPANQRDIVILRLYHNRTFDEISRAKGTSTTKIWRDYRRALRQLRERLHHLHLSAC